MCVREERDNMCRHAQKQGRKCNYNKVGDRVRLFLF